MIIYALCFAMLVATAAATAPTNVEIMNYLEACTTDEVSTGCDTGFTLRKDGWKYELPAWNLHDDDTEFTQTGSTGSNIQKNILGYYTGWAKCDDTSDSDDMCAQYENGSDCGDHGPRKAMVKFVCDAPGGVSESPTCTYHVTSRLLQTTCAAAAAYANASGHDDYSDAASTGYGRRRQAQLPPMKVAEAGHA